MSKSDDIENDVENTHPKQRALHIVAHLIVVQRHDLYQALESTNLDRGVAVLSCFTDDLHDVIPFPLDVED